MSDDPFDDDTPPPSGTPSWVVTFADLMSLLLTFFVLLLSSATMDAIRFKKMADSLKDAFGVQREVPVYDQVMGTNIIGQQFSPAPIKPTHPEEMWQPTAEEKPLEPPEAQAEKLEADLLRQRQEQVEKEAMKLRQLLENEIKSGLLTLETQNLKIIIRIHEKGSFPSGSAVLKPGFEPVMKKLAEAAVSVEGRIVIAGHTDNRPIATEVYRSNWELSASRAVTVAHGILRNGTIDHGRIIILGHADTKPLAPNSSEDNRAKNRRVEIILVHHDDMGLHDPTIFSQQ